MVVKDKKGAEVEGNTINLATEKFGEICVERENIITFKDGIVGFEELNQFVVVNIEECRPFEWLISIENPSVAFPIINPAPFFSDYNPIKSLEDISPLDKKDVKNIETFCVVTLGDKPENVTVNLKGPILVNMKNKTGKQFILTEDFYNLHHPLVRK
jgi:flagellar assembly factor FliW